jgi:hypothetical protein
MGILPGFLADSSLRVILDTPQHIGFASQFRSEAERTKREN